jgi:methyl-accepting chemotaxis protein
MILFMKKRPKKDGKFRSTEVGALLEAIKAEIRPILEDIPSIKAKLDSTFEQVGKNTETLSFVGMQIKSLQEKVGENTKEIRLNRDLINRVLEELKSKVERKDFELLEKKVASITG